MLRNLMPPPPAFCLLYLLSYTRGVNICRNDRKENEHPGFPRGSVSPELGVSMLRNIQTESVSPSAYWRKLKQRHKEEGNETVTNCHSLKMLAEATTTEISKDKKPKTFEQSRQIARKGGSVAGNTRKEIEQNIGKKVVTKLNAKLLDKDKPKVIE